MASSKRVYKEYPCSFSSCNEIFIFKSALKKHEEDQHPIIINRFSCDVCDQQFFWKQYYVEHMESRGHSAMLELSMNKSNNNQQGPDDDSQDIQILLDETIEINSEDLNDDVDPEIVQLVANEDAIEDLNNNAEPDDIDLDLEVLGLFNSANGGMKTIACSICSQVFPGAKVPVKHLDNHKEMEKRQKFKDVYIYQCPDCTNLYKLPSSLSRHKKVAHENYRPFDCPKCDFGFYEQRSLRSHLRAKHGTRTPKAIKKVGKGRPPKPRDTKMSVKPQDTRGEVKVLFDSSSQRRIARASGKPRPLRRPADNK